MVGDDFIKSRGEALKVSPQQLHRSLVDRFLGAVSDPVAGLDELLKARSDSGVVAVSPGDVGIPRGPSKPNQGEEVVNALRSWIHETPPKRLSIQTRIHVTKALLHEVLDGALEVGAEEEDRAAIQTHDVVATSWIRSVGRRDCAMRPEKIIDVSETIGERREGCRRHGDLRYDPARFDDVLASRYVSAHRITTTRLGLASGARDSWRMTAMSPRPPRWAPS